MRVLIAGGGKAGSFLAETLKDDHRVTVIESRMEQVSTIRKLLPGVEVIRGDACEPNVLEKAGANLCDMVAALTGDDEDNLVISFLAKSQNKVPLVFARINDPRNEWLFGRDWGVDVAVSSTSIIASLVQGELELGDIITLLRLRAGNLAIEELTLPASATAVGKTLAEIAFPPKCMVMAIIAGGEVKVPRGSTTLEEGDRLLLLADRDEKPALEEALGLKPPSR